MVVPDHQEYSYRNRKQEWSDQGYSNQSVFLLGPYDPSVSPGKDLLHLLFIFQNCAVRSSECPFPPGNQSFGEKCEKVNPGNTSHIGPEDGLQKTKFKLEDDQGKGRSEFKGAEEYGK